MSRRALFYTLLVLFVAALCTWCFYFPHNEDLLYRSIPNNATFVSRHERLAGRWQVLARSPLVRRVLATHGVSEEQIEAVLDDPQLASSVDRLVGRDTVVAYMERYGSTADEGWIAASWVGASSQLIRLGVASGRFGDLERIGIADGRHVWSLDPKLDDPRLRLSFHVSGGLFLACLSTDPAGVAVMLRSGLRGKRAMEDLRRNLSDGGADRGWFCWFERDGQRLQRRELRCAIRVQDETRCDGWVRGYMGIPSVTGSLEPDISGNPLLSVLPEAVAMVPFGQIAPLLGAKGMPPWWQTIARVVGEELEPDSSVIACILGDDYAGRIMGYRVPTLMLGVRVREPANVIGAIRLGLDTLNADKGWALIPHIVFTENADGGETVLTVINSTKRDALRALDPKERPSFAMSGDWLLLSSNLGAIRKLVASPGNEPSPPFRELRRSVDPDTRLYFWLDIDDTAEELEHAIAVYKLGLMMENAELAADTRRAVETVESWMQALRPFGTGCFRVTELENGHRVDFRLGPNAGGR